MSERLTDNPTLFRLRVRYGKRGRLKYLGHLELIHTIERIVRRAGLPYAVTQGFSPHMRVGFSSALPVGTSSTCEWYDLFMTEFVALDEAFERLAAARLPIWRLSRLPTSTCARRRSLLSLRVCRTASTCTWTPRPP